VVAIPAVGSNPHPSVTNPTPTGLTPSQIAQAYGFSQVSQTGAGETIAIVDAYNNPNIASDLAAFDAQFQLPAANLTVVNQSGGKTLPRTDPGWALEIALDVEWAHAVAPGANILLVEASSASLGSLLTGVNYARSQPGVVAVSMSWGTTEFFFEWLYDGYFTTPAGHGGVTFVAATGDDGGIYGPQWPSVSPNVLSVGGTTLTTRADGTYVQESGWVGSNGGISAVEPEPAYQSSFPAGGVQTTGRRTTPDVAYNADPNSGFAVYDSVTIQNQSGWFKVGGTSAGAPQWAGIIARIDQALPTGTGPLDGVNQTLPDLYYLASTASAPSFFHDVTTGNNAYFAATPGYDAVTGLGTPIVSGLIGAAAGTSASSSAAATTTASLKPVTAAATPHDVLSVPVVIVVTSRGGTSTFVIFVPIANSTQLVATTPPAAPNLVSEVALSFGQSVAARPVQPLVQSSDASRLVSPFEDRGFDELLQRGGDVVPDDQQDAQGERPAAVEPETRWRVGLWDDALAGFEMEDRAPALPPVSQSLHFAAVGQPGNATEGSAVAAAVAVTLWGTWEYRSRKNDRRRRGPSKRGGS
jgi:subtilase family serine protease